MMLRVSLRSRELLGARPPIFPWAPVPGSQCSKQDLEAHGFHQGFQGFRTLSRACGILRSGGGAFAHGNA